MDKGHYWAISLHSELINSLSGEPPTHSTREPLTPQSPKINPAEPEAQNPQCFVQQGRAHVWFEDKAVF